MFVGGGAARAIYFSNESTVALLHCAIFRMGDFIGHLISSMIRAEIAQLTMA